MARERGGALQTVGDLAIRYRIPLIRWFERRGLDREGAEDSAQETFARMCAQGSRVERPDGYLFAVAASVLSDHGRSQRVRRDRQHIPLELFDWPSEEPAANRVYDGKEALRRLATVLAALPQRTREIFLLSRIDQLSYTQLAVRFGISVSAIEKHMMRAIAHLHRSWPHGD